MISSFVIWGIGSFLVSILIFLFCKVLGLDNLYSKGTVKVPDLNAPLLTYIGLLVEMCVIAPITEELLFRMVLFKIGFALTSSVTAVVLITSILFAMVHTDKFPPKVFPMPQLLGGVVMGVGFLYGGIWFSIGIHAVHNFCAFLYLIIVRIWNKCFGA